MSELTHEQVRAALAETERKRAHLLGKMEATYEALPRDEGLIAEIIAETGASRDKVVERLQVIADRELSRLREEHPDPGPDDQTTLDPTVKRFREMLGDGAA